MAPRFTTVSRQQQYLTHPLMGFGVLFVGGAVAHLPKHLTGSLRPWRGSTQAPILASCVSAVLLYFQLLPDLCAGPPLRSGAGCVNRTRSLLPYSVRVLGSAICAHAHTLHVFAPISLFSLQLRFLRLPRFLPPVKRSRPSSEPLRLGTQPGHHFHAVWINGYLCRYLLPAWCHRILRPQAPPRPE